VHEKRALVTPIIRVNDQVKVRLFFASEQQRAYVEFEGNKNDIIDVLMAFGVIVLLLSIAVVIIRG